MLYSTSTMTKHFVECRSVECRYAKCHMASYLQAIMAESYKTFCDHNLRIFKIIS
jgi:hypothetical protein